MNLDASTVAVMTALVVNVAGIVFIAETLIRRDEGAGRIWALAFLAAMLTTISYLVWSFAPGAWWSIGVGNGAYVAGAGCIWLGCRRYNERRILISSLIVGGGVLASTVAALITVPQEGGWGGAVWMFVALVAFASAGCVESLRGEMGRSRTSWGLAFVLALEAAFSLIRIPIFLVAGPDSDLFRLTFGTITASALTVALTIVTVVVTSVLRAGRVGLRTAADLVVVDSGSDGILTAPGFAEALRTLCERAARRGELVGVIAVTIDDIEQISTAFGSDIARAVTGRWRLAVRRHAPSYAFVGETGSATLAVGVLAETAGGARRDAADIYRGMFEDLGGMTGGVIPVMGVGIGLSDTAGYDAEALVRIARDAADRAATSVETSVLIGDAG